LVRDNILCQLTLESPWTHPPIFQLIAGAALKGARIVIDLSFFSVLLLTYPWHAFLKRRQGKCFTALEGTNDGHELLIPQKKKKKKKHNPRHGRSLFVAPGTSTQEAWDHPTTT
jgi:hypothetical protein